MLTQNHWTTVREGSKYAEPKPGDLPVMLSANFGVGNRSKMQNHCAYRSMMPIWYRALFLQAAVFRQYRSEGEVHEKSTFGGQLRLHLSISR